MYCTQGTYNYFTYMWASVTNLKQLVQTVLPSVITTPVTISGGSLSDTGTNDDLQATKFNYNVVDAAADSAFDLSTVLGLPGIDEEKINIQCTQCYAYSQMQLVVNFVVSNYAVQYAQVYVDGDVNYRMQAGGILNDLSGSFSNNVSQWISPDVSFFLGPIVVTAFAESSMMMGVIADVSSSAQVAVDLYLQNHVKAGFAYNISTAVVDKPNEDPVSKLLAFLIINYNIKM